MGVVFVVDVPLFPQTQELEVKQRTYLFGHVDSNAILQNVVQVILVLARHDDPGVGRMSMDLVTMVIELEFMPEGNKASSLAVLVSAGEMALVEVDSQVLVVPVEDVVVDRTADGTLLVVFFEMLFECVLIVETLVTKLGRG